MSFYQKKNREYYTNYRLFQLKGKIKQYCVGDDPFKNVLIIIFLLILYFHILVT